MQGRIGLKKVGQLHQDAGFSTSPVRPFLDTPLGLLRNARIGCSFHLAVAHMILSPLHSHELFTRYHELDLLSCVSIWIARSTVIGCTRHSMRLQRGLFDRQGNNCQSRNTKLRTSKLGRDHLLNLMFIFPRSVFLLYINAHLFKSCVSELKYLSR